ncbi:MAG: alkaline phosphatase [Gammaproteobacteria bacterium]|nr:alkaline phosphatase [Gammaproteobacteria bacterium]
MKNNSHWHKLALGISAAMILAGCADDDSGPIKATPLEPSLQRLSLPQAQRDSHWFVDGNKAVEMARAQKINNTPGAAKNIILFVGDGMGISTVTAARIFAGQLQGGKGEDYQFNFEQFPFSGLVKTYNTNQQTPDSAGTMTAMMTGVKTKAGVLNITETVARGDCPASKEYPLTTALELAEGLGKSTGIISTARITHATPGATYAKIPERDWEASAPEGCKDIALQMVEQSTGTGDGIDLMLGGGRRNFLPIADGGKRVDALDLTAQWRNRYNDGTTNAVYITDQSALKNIDITATDKLLGLFSSSHMHYEADRDVNQEPSLSEMTEKGLELLQKNDKGYFLMVESGRIDHAHHAGNAFNALNDTVEFSRAIEVAMENTNPEDTLIIVTADHSHVMTIAGYPTRGNPILGKVIGNDKHGNPNPLPNRDAEELPYTTLTYANGPGFADLGEVTNADAENPMAEDPEKGIHHRGRQNLTNINTEVPGFHQESLVPLPSETHAGEDVGVWALGPGAHLLTGTNEQNVIFHVMAHAGGLLKE